MRSIELESRCVLSWMPGSRAEPVIGPRFARTRCGAPETATPHRNLREEIAHHRRGAPVPLWISNLFHFHSSISPRAKTKLFAQLKRRRILFRATESKYVFGAT
jgi:hypothetical protein